MTTVSQDTSVVTMTPLGFYNHRNSSSNLFGWNFRANATIVEMNMRHDVNARSLFSRKRLTKRQSDLQIRETSDDY